MWSIITGKEVIYFYIRPFYILTFTITTLILGRYFVKTYRNISKYVLKYSNCVFFIYASHILIITVYSFMPIPTYSNGWINLLLYVIGISSIWLVGVLSFKLINAKIPLAGMLLNGGRI